MKKFLKVFLLILLFIPAVFFSGCYGNNTIINNQKNNNYYVNNYVIDIKVNEDRVCTITEQIEVKYKVWAAGLVRYIPTTHYVYRADGSKDLIDATVSNFKTINNGAIENTIYSSYVENSYYIVELGYASKTNQETHNYYFSYNYNLGNDPASDFDEFYLNVVGTQWDCEINNVSFTITLPKDFDFSGDKFGASCGEFGADVQLTNLNIQKVDDKVEITGGVNFLDAFEGVTVRAQMPEGYFNYNPDYMLIIGIGLVSILIILIVIISYIIWFKHGRDEKPTIPVNFYPPNNMDPVDMEFQLKLKISTKSISALIVFLASKGYIIIEDLEGSDDQNLKKVKEYDGNNSDCKGLMNALFSTEDIISVKQLSDKLKNYTEFTFNKHNKEENRYACLETSNYKSGIKLIFINVIFLLINLLITGICIGKLGILVPHVVANFASMIFAGVTCYILFRSDTKESRVSGCAINLAFSIFIGCLNITMLTYLKPLFIVFVIFSIVAYYISSIFISFMSRRNKHNIEIVGQILGFKNFLLHVEKEKLEALVNEDPEYFYNIMPYTYVLNISDKWIKKLDYIYVEPPKWIDTSYKTNTRHFIILFSNNIRRTGVEIANRIRNQKISNIVSSVNSGSGSSGGFGGGGGFSGGGSGGGGGSMR